MADENERTGFGDDQGTRVGKPDAPRRTEQDEAARRAAGPSTRPVKEGLEGSILEDDETTRDNA